MFASGVNVGPANNELTPVTLVPEITRFDNVPTEVMLGCALVYTVPASNALPTYPLTLAPATALALSATIALLAVTLDVPVAFGIYL